MDEEKIWEWDENKMDDDLIENWEDNQLEACCNTPLVRAKRHNCMGVSDKCKLTFNAEKHK